MRLLWEDAAKEAAGRWMKALQQDKPPKPPVYQNPLLGGGYAKR
jgi:hypothetical protein